MALAIKKSGLIPSGYLTLLVDDLMVRLTDSGVRTCLNHIQSNFSKVPAKLETKVIQLLCPRCLSIVFVPHVWPLKMWNMMFQTMDLDDFGAPQRSKIALIFGHLAKSSLLPSETMFANIHCWKVGRSMSPRSAEITCTILRSLQLLSAPVASSWNHHVLGLRPGLKNTAIHIIHMPKGAPSLDLKSTWWFEHIWTMIPFEVEP